MKSIIVILLIFLTTATFGQNNFQKHFDGFSLKGSTTIYDYKDRRWVFTDSTDAQIATLPASTFKILNSLIALENKLVNDENEVIKWDGKEQTFFGAKIEAWNKDTDLKTAYKNSTVWFYVEIAKRLGRKKYKKTLESCNYGNLNFSKPSTDFWNYGAFAITPKNQIEFLIKLYENRLPFSQTNLEKVKKIMISEQTANHTIRDKTGWTRRNGKDIGWWVGYIQANDNVYFFATRIIKDVNDNNPNFSSARKEITKQILKDLNALQ